MSMKETEMIHAWKSIAIALAGLLALAACAGDEAESGGSTSMAADRDGSRPSAAGSGAGAAGMTGSDAPLRPTPVGPGMSGMPPGAAPCMDADGCPPQTPDSCTAGMNCTPAEVEDCSPDELSGRSFCDPATWGGSAPSADSEVVISSGQVVLLDCMAEARTLEIEAGGVLRASHEQASRLTLRGNLVVRGRLEYGRPGCRIPATVSAEIVFAGMRDDQYVGTPSPAEGAMREPNNVAMEPIASDVGLWVVDQGVFAAAGALKKAWSFLLEGAGPGDASFVVEDATGWSAGDRIVLTPTAERSQPDHVRQFDERTLAAVEGTSATLDSAPTFAHAGCSDCMRRGEAANLTRNVVVRSADDSGHAHMMIAQQGLLQLDSVELRWLGPEWGSEEEDGARCGGPQRRAPIWFHQQDDAADASFVRHAAIWGGQRHFVMVERSNQIELTDIAGYDSLNTGYGLFYECVECEREIAPQGIVMREVLAAKVGAGLREEGCLRIVHRHTGFTVSGGEGSGCERCVATGIGVVGSGADMSGFAWQEGGSGRPLDFVFKDNVAHNNGNHGAFIWHNEAESQPPYEHNAFWSNDAYGIHWGAYGNQFVLQDFTAVDNGLASVGVRAIPGDERPRLDGATIDDLHVLAYLLVQRRPNILRELTFTGAKPVAFSQIHDACEGGDETDPLDPDCTRIWLRIENPTFPSGVKPFEFGWTANRESIWEVRGFSHPDAEYRDLPADFDLHRRDNQIAGGALHSGFDAWLVPR
jgi:hypothetical protein